jgi:hypothetical protein
MRHHFLDPHEAPRLQRPFIPVEAFTSAVALITSPSAGIRAESKGPADDWTGIGACGSCIEDQKLQLPRYQP